MASDADAASRLSALLAVCKEKGIDVQELEAPIVAKKPDAVPEVLAEGKSVHEEVAPGASGCVAATSNANKLLETDGSESETMEIDDDDASQTKQKGKRESQAQIVSVLGLKLQRPV